MRHLCVGKHELGRFLSARVVNRVGLAGNHSTHVKWNTSGGTRSPKPNNHYNIVSFYRFSRRPGRFFLFSFYGSPWRAFFIVCRNSQLPVGGDQTAKEITKDF